jgi:hypothetical protein
MEQRYNMVVPDTAVSDAFHVGSGPTKRVRQMGELRDAGYDVCLFGVYCSKDTCIHNGTERQATEGKIFSPSGWSWAVMMIPILFAEHRNLGFRTCNRLVDNTHWWKSEGAPGKVPAMKELVVGPEQCLEIEWIDGRLAYGIDATRARLSLADWEDPNAPEKVLDGLDLLGM